MDYRVIRGFLQNGRLRFYALLGTARAAGFSGTLDLWVWRCCAWNIYKRLDLGYQQWFDFYRFRGDGAGLDDRFDLEFSFFRIILRLSFSLAILLTIVAVIVNIRFCEVYV